MVFVMVVCCGVVMVVCCGVCDGGLLWWWFVVVVVCCGGSFRASTVRMTKDVSVLEEVKMTLKYRNYNLKDVTR